MTAGVKSGTLGRQARPKTAAQGVMGSVHTPAARNPRNLLGEAQRAVAQEWQAPLQSRAAKQEVGCSGAR